MHFFLKRSPVGSESKQAGGCSGAVMSDLPPQFFNRYGQRVFFCGLFSKPDTVSHSGHTFLLFFFSKETE